MKRILYLMHVPWAWIKQRPHFFAEMLSEDCVVDVFYKKPFKVSKRNLLTGVPGGNSNLKIRGFYFIPTERLALLKYFSSDWINTLLFRWQLPDLKNYDYVWIPSSLFYAPIHKSVRKKQLIYDCMDDMLEFDMAKNHPKLYEKLLYWEIELLKDAEFVFCSSDYLKNKILKRANLDRDIITINNAISLPEDFNSKDLPLEIQDMILYVNKLSHPLLYVGTISAWFDFPLILKTLQRFSNIDVVLIGPADISIPNHERIHYLGTVEREYLYPLMQCSWALVMPFIINELIRSVNPVKLYEYIYMKKPIIVPKYSEMQKFAAFVNQYENEAEFIEILKTLLINGGEISENESCIMLDYAKSNTWKHRYEQIKAKMHL